MPATNQNASRGGVPSARGGVARGGGDGAKGVGTTEYVVTSYQFDGEWFDPDAIRWERVFATEKQAEGAPTDGDTLAKMERHTWRERVFTDEEFGVVRDVEAIHDDDFYREWDRSTGWSSHE